MSSRAVDKGEADALTDDDSGGLDFLEPFLGGTAREPTDFFAVRRNVFAHFLLRAAGGRRRERGQKISNLFLLCTCHKHDRLWRASGQVLGREARERRTAASTLAGELISGVSWLSSEMTEMSCRVGTK